MEHYDLILLSVALFGLTLIFGGLYVWVQMGEKSASGRPASRQGSGEESGSSGGNSTGSNGLRRRRTGNNGTNEEEDDDASVLAGLDPGSKQYKKLSQKIAKKQAREEAAARIASENESKKKKSKKQLEYEKREEEREEKERLAQVERKKLLEEEAAAEEEEYNQWKDMFETEDSGSASTGQVTDTTDVFFDFLSFIRTKKVVVLEDLASEFNISGQDTIERVESLIEMGRLTGVIDDRGKFILVTTAEMLNIADFVVQNGRISMSTLAKQSNRLINLEEVHIAAKDDEEAEAAAEEEK